MNMEQTPKIPKLLIVDDDQATRCYATGFFRDWCDQVDTAKNTEDAEEKLGKNRYDVFLLDIHMPGEYGITIANSYKKRFPWALICLWTSGSISSYNDLTGEFLCFLKTGVRKTTVMPVLLAWARKWQASQRKSWTATLEKLPDEKLVEVVIWEPQEKLSAAHFRLARDHDANFIGVAMRKDGHVDEINLCMSMGGCPGRCKMCGTAKYCDSSLELTRYEAAEQVAVLLKSNKSFNAIEEKIRVSNHGGRDPRYCMDEYCGAMDIIDSWGLNTHHISTSIGGKGVFEELVARSSGRNIILELSVNSMVEAARAWLMPATEGDNLQRQIDFLAEDCVKNNHSNRLRQLLFRGSDGRGFNCMEREADSIEKSMRGTDLSWVITRTKRSCLSRYPELLSKQFGMNFVRMLKERGVNACDNDNLGVGPVDCGEHVNYVNRLKMVGLE